MRTSILLSDSNSNPTAADSRIRVKRYRFRKYKELNISDNRKWIFDFFVFFGYDRATLVLTLFREIVLQRSSYASSPRPIPSLDHFPVCTVRPCVHQSKTFFTIGRSSKTRDDGLSHPSTPLHLYYARHRLALTRAHTHTLVT